MDERFGLSRFDGGAPGGGPSRFFGDFFRTRNWGFGFDLMRFELAALLALSVLFACFFFGITISS